MGGPATVLVVHSPQDVTNVKQLLTDVERRLKELEQKWSRYKPDSLISLINARAGSGTATEVDAETYHLLEVCRTLWTESNGLFDPTAGVLRHVWDFQRGTLLEPEKLAALLQCIGFDRVILSNNTVQLEIPHAELDLGGVGKEYAADVAAAMLREAGYNNGLVELAGDIVALGHNPKRSPWQVGIRDPASPERSHMTLEIENAAVATSGSYYRTIHQGDHQYSHLLDPRTGWPVEGPRSATVIAENCLIAGAVSTVACLKQMPEATKWLEESSLPWLLISAEGALSGPLGQKSS
jgi:thiamine biosynthesis lipoprotein